MVDYRYGRDMSVGRDVQRWMDLPKKMSDAMAVYHVGSKHYNFT